jgi:hypothetical protein
MPAASRESLASFSSTNINIATQKHQHHFLQGIQLDSCSDLLSIPDPPSPGKQVLNRRRMSSPLVRPFRDLSNEPHIDNTPTTKTITSAIKQVQSRKSLCHVPFSPPASLDQASAGESTTLLPPALIVIGSRDEQEATSTTIDYASVTRRRKKRQSIVLPIDHAAQDGMAADCICQTFVTFKKPSPERFEAPETASPESHIFTTDNLAELRRLVREYCSLPPDARVGSTDAKGIENLCGYIVAPPLPDDTDLKAPVSQSILSSQESKMELLRPMEPALRRMDNAKIKESKKIQDITECLVQKSGGKYRYFHLPTGRHISADEYEQRYRLMLDEITKIRSEEWANYFQDIQSNRGVILSPIAGLHAREKLLAAKKVTTDTIEGDFETKLENHPSPPSIQLSSFAATPPTPDCRLSGSSSDSTSSMTTSALLRGDETRQLHDKDCSDMDESPTTEEDMVLPITSRVDSSSDPDIARAEIKLWATIDRALEVYSEEVLVIQAARRRDAP